MSASTARATASAPASVVVIKPTSGWLPPRLGELWSQRELFYFFVWRDIKVKYAQTLLGGLWTVFQPLALMAVFLIAFRKLGKIETGEVAYPVFALAGLVFWMFFSRGLAMGANSLVANVDLLTKSSCPRLLIPLATLTSGLFDFLVALLLFLGFAGAYGELPSWRFALVPVVLALGFMFALGMTLLLSATTVRYRDIRLTLPFLIQLWLFLSPVAYPLRAAGEPWTTVLAFNPLVGIVEAFRWALLATPPPSTFAMALAGGISVLTLLAGLAYFSRVERIFADVI